MPLTNKLKQEIVKELRNKLPEIKINNDRTVVRVFQVDELAEFIYNIYERGLNQGRENAKKNLKNKVKSALNKAISNY